MRHFSAAMAGAVGALVSLPLMLLEPRDESEVRHSFSQARIFCDLGLGDEITWCCPALPSIDLALDVVSLCLHVHLLKCLKF